MKPPRDNDALTMSHGAVNESFLGLVLEWARVRVVVILLVAIAMHLGCDRSDHRATTENGLGSRTTSGMRSRRWERGSPGPPAWKKPWGPTEQRWRSVRASERRSIGRGRRITSATRSGRWASGSRGQPIWRRPWAPTALR